MIKKNKSSEYVLGVEDTIEEVLKLADSPKLAELNPPSNRALVKLVAKYLENELNG